MPPKDIASLSIEKKIPLYIFLELTRNCNLNCIHCYITRLKKQELSLKEIKDILDQLKDINSLIINFSGGEIFTRKDFFEIAHYAKKQKFAIKFFTNGTMIDSDVAEKIKDLSPLRVEVSIYSANPKIHDSITNSPGSLELSLKALKELSKRNIPLRIKCPLMKQNRKDYHNIIKLAQKLGAKYQVDPLIFPKDNGRLSPLRLRINEKELLNVISDPLLKELPSDTTRKFPCSAGYNSCAISCYGDVYPCIVIPISMGNLRKEKFKDIWYKSKFVNKFRKIQWKNLKVCANCNLSLSCSRCPGLAYLENRDLLGPATEACKIAKIKNGTPHG